MKKIIFKIGDDTNPHGGMPHWSVDCYNLWKEQFDLSILKTPHNFKIYSKAI